MDGKIMNEVLQTITNVFDDRLCLFETEKATHAAWFQAAFHKKQAELGISPGNVASYASRTMRVGPLNAPVVVGSVVAENKGSDEKKPDTTHVGGDSAPDLDEIKARIHKDMKVTQLRADLKKRGVKTSKIRRKSGLVAHLAQILYDEELELLQKEKENNTSGDNSNVERIDPSPLKPVVQVANSNQEAPASPMTTHTVHDATSLTSPKSRLSLGLVRTSPLKSSQKPKADAEQADEKLVPSSARPRLVDFGDDRESKQELSPVSENLDVLGNAKSSTPKDTATPGKSQTPGREEQAQTAVNATENSTKSASKGEPSHSMSDHKDDAAAPKSQNSSMSTKPNQLVTPVSSSSSLGMNDSPVPTNESIASSGKPVVSSAKQMASTAHKVSASVPEETTPEPTAKPAAPSTNKPVDSSPQPSPDVLAKTPDQPTTANMRIEKHALSSRPAQQSAAKGPFTTNKPTPISTPTRPLVEPGSDKPREKPPVFVAKSVSAAQSAGQPGPGTVLSTEAPQVAPKVPTQRPQSFLGSKVLASPPKVHKSPKDAFEARGRAVPTSNAVAPSVAVAKSTTLEHVRPSSQQTEPTVPTMSKEEQVAEQVRKQAAIYRQQARERAVQSAAEAERAADARKATDLVRTNVERNPPVSKKPTENGGVSSKAGSASTAPKPVRNTAPSNVVRAPANVSRGDAFNESMKNKAAVGGGTWPQSKKPSSQPRSAAGEVAQDKKREEKRAHERPNNIVRAENGFFSNNALKKKDDKQTAPMKPRPRVEALERNAMLKKQQEEIEQSRKAKLKMRKLEADRKREILAKSKNQAEGGPVPPPRPHHPSRAQVQQQQAPRPKPAVPKQQHVRPPPSQDNRPKKPQQPQPPPPSSGEVAQYDISTGESSSDSSDSESESEKPGRKKIPAWAKGQELQEALHRQFGAGSKLDPDRIFPEVPACNLDEIFSSKKKKKKKRPRGSSAHWHRDGLTEEERRMYRRDMGFASPRGQPSIFMKTF